MGHVKTILKNYADFPTWFTNATTSFYLAQIPSLPIVSNFNKIITNKVQTDKRLYKYRINSNTASHF